MKEYIELLDLVDDNDNVIGQMTRGEIYAKNLNNIRVVNGFVVNSEGKLWIPRRTATKTLYPNALDVSVGGHIDAGETYEDAFKRETLEETNINLSLVNFKELAYLNAKEHRVHCFQKVYEIRSDETPKYNPHDFSEYYWLTPQEIIDRVEKQGDIAKSDLVTLIKLLYL